MNSRAKWALKALVAFLLLGWLLSKSDAASLWRLLASQSPVVMVAMSAIQLLGVIVGTAKWRALLPAEKFGRLFRLNMAAIFYSLIFPGQISAEAIKAYQLGRGRADAETVAASVILDKVTGLLSVLGLGLVGALLTTLPLGQSLRLTLLLLFIGGCAGLLGLRLPTLRSRLVAGVDRLARRVPRFERPCLQLGRFIDAWCAYLQRPAPLISSLLLGLIQQGIYIGIVVLLSWELGFALPALEWCWIFALASVAAVLPISLAGIGVREGVFVGLLAAFAIPAEQALALSLTLFGLHLALGLAAGAYELLRPANQR